jgi:hypothetical protein
MPRPGAIKTHLPFDLNPYHPQAKYIIVLRNPKDACVSFYYHQSMFPCYQFEEGSFREFFKVWIKGDIESGSYFDWVLTWWRHRHEPNVLVLLYEDMKRDIKSNVMKIASFLGKDYSDRLGSDPLFMEKVIEKSSIEYMKKTTNKSMYKSHVSNLKDPSLHVKEEKFHFIRKGAVGDWVSHFTPQENAIMEETVRQKFGGTGLENLWDDFGVFSKEKSEESDHK